MPVPMNISRLFAILRHAGCAPWRRFYIGNGHYTIAAYIYASTLCLLIDSVGADDAAE